jgi:hypothetical protein
LNTTCSVSRKHEKVEKVTAAPDDRFVGGLEILLVGYAENTKRSKKTQALRMTILWKV